ncbi:hypothetical protein C8R42DRAFT_716528 [Lentinula raphanica]|nr:hypothetical protein C8R42DRAFT_716528 [Lentinula raphanica]
MALRIPDLKRPGKFLEFGLGVETGFPGLQSTEMSSLASRTRTRTCQARQSVEYRNSGMRHFPMLDVGIFEYHFVEALKHAAENRIPPSSLQEDLAKDWIISQSFVKCEDNRLLHALLRQKPGITRKTSITQYSVLLTSHPITFPGYPCVLGYLKLSHSASVSVSGSLFWLMRHNVLLDSNILGSQKQVHTQNARTNPELDVSSTFIPRPRGSAESLGSPSLYR